MNSTLNKDILCHILFQIPLDLANLLKSVSKIFYAAFILMIRIYYLKRSISLFSTPTLLHHYFTLSKYTILSLQFIDILFPSPLFIKEFIEEFIQWVDCDIFPKLYYIDIFNLCSLLKIHKSVTCLPSKKGHQLYQIRNTTKIYSNYSGPHILSKQAFNNIKCYFDPNNTTYFDYWKISTFITYEFSSNGQNIILLYFR